MEKNMLKVNEDFIKNYDEDSDKGYFLEADVKYLKRLHNLHCDFTILTRKNEKLINAITLYAICMIKKTILFT